MSVSNEPLITAAVIASIAGAIITLLKTLGVPISVETQAALSSLVVLVAPLGVAWYARSKVTPLANPKDELGRPLSGPNGEPTIAQTRSLLKK